MLIMTGRLRCFAERSALEPTGGRISGASGQPIGIAVTKSALLMAFAASARLKAAWPFDPEASQNLLEAAGSAEGERKA